MTGGKKRNMITLTIAQRVIIGIVFIIIGILGLIYATKVHWLLPANDGTLFLYTLVIAMTLFFAPLGAYFLMSCLWQ